MKIDELCALMTAYAREIAQQNGRGALHVFVEDGNCERETIEWCMEQPDITPTETAFCQRVLHDLTEEQCFGAWALAQCDDAT